MVAGAGAVVSSNPLKLDYRSHSKCLAICAVITVSSFQYGLDYALVGGFMAMPGFLRVFGYFDEPAQKWAIDTTVQQLISSLMTVGTFVGSLAIGPFSSRFGRRNGLWTASALNAISTGIMMGTTTVGPLYFARFLLGISVGWFLTFGQVYINEAAPAHLRGIVFAVYQTQLSIGSVIGAAVDYGTHNIETKNAYRIPLALFFIAPTVQSIALVFFPESPRWLMAHGREDSAELALRKLRGRTIEEVAFQAELNEIRISTRQQVEHSKRKKKQLWLEIWNKSNRRRTLLSIAVVCCHCAAGSSYLTIYTTYFLTTAGIPADRSFEFSTMITCMGLLGILSSFFWADKVDRRAIFMIGVAVCGLTQLGFAVAWTAAPGTETAGKVVVGLIAIFTFFYTAFGPYAWMVGAEYPNNHLRAHTFGLATALNFLGNWVGIFTAPYFINPASLGWSAKYGYIWFASNTIVFLFTYFFLPETRGRTLEEIHEMFEEGVPSKKFKGFVCAATQAMATEVLEKERNEHIEEIKTP
ncbi:hypothetical protein LA080_003413 [Diaporthe eres]|uniref:Major facilitator superfamily (MFS) profile domain-containing protein n=1 Tax=Diaporthe vaccinii TaxID=105482 RepID=A0ABR4E0A0_9PEZI|nr:hypothetical protein LA080_003413 [Diaporthe eres]